LGQAADVEELAHGAVRLAPVPDDIALVADRFFDQAYKFGNGQVLAAADIDQGGVLSRQQGGQFRIRHVHEEEAGVGQVVAVEEFAARRAGAPGGHAFGLLTFRPVHFMDQGRQDVGIVQVVIIAGAVEIGGHHGQEAGVVLAVVGPACFYAGDLGYGIGPVGRLQRAGQQVFLPDGLGALLGIDAGGSQEQEPFDAVAPGLVEHVILDEQVLVDELRRIGVVGQNAADPGRGQEDVIGLFLGKECRDRLLIQQIKFRVGPGEQVGVSISAQSTEQCRAHQAAMAGYVDFVVSPHGVYSKWSNTS